MRDYSKLTKPTPERYCEYCGKKLERKRFTRKLEDLGVFNKRKYCDRMCMRRAFVKDGLNDQCYSSAHQSARKLVYLVEEREMVCEICGSKRNVDVHHKDGNYQNNNTDNLILVCRSCHMKQHRPRPKCKICDKPADGGRGYCNAHYIRWKKYGDPLHYFNKQVTASFFQTRCNNN